MIAYVSRPDVKFIYDEVYARGCYDFALGDGEDAREDADADAGARRVVVDVGANIGLSSVKFARALGNDERAIVVALEPIPRTYAALRENLLRLVFSEEEASNGGFADDAFQSNAPFDAASSLADAKPIGGGPGTGHARVYAHNVGVGSRSGASIEFTHFPRCLLYTSDAADE